MFVACCIRNRLCLSPDSPLSKVIDSVLWLSIASSVGKGVIYHICPGTESNGWSNNVAYFIGENAIDADAFRILTNKNLLPTVDPNAAVILLDKERAHGLYERLLEENETKDMDVDGVRGVDDVRDDNGSTQLTCLQDRCVESFNLANLECESQEDLREKALRVMSHTVMNAFLRKNLCRTRQTLKRKNDEISQTKKEKNDLVKEKSDALRQLRTEKSGNIKAVNKLMQKRSYLKTSYEHAIRNQIIEVIARHQKEFKLQTEDIVSMLPDIPQRDVINQLEDVKDQLAYLVTTNQIMYTSADKFYTVGQDVIIGRASTILKAFKRGKFGGSNGTDKLTKDQLYAALRGLSSSQSDVDQIIETLRSRGFLVCSNQSHYNSTRYNSTALYTIN